MNKLEWFKNFIVKSSSTKKCSNELKETDRNVKEGEEGGGRWGGGHPPAHHGGEEVGAQFQSHQCPPRLPPDQPDLTCTHDEYCGFCAICSICYVKKYEEKYKNHDDEDVPDTCPCFYGSECIYCGFCTTCREIQQIEERGWLYNIYWRYCLREKMKLKNRRPYRGFFRGFF